MYKKWLHANAVYYAFVPGSHASAGCTELCLQTKRSSLMKEQLDHYAYMYVFMYVCVFVVMQLLCKYSIYVLDSVF